MSVGTVNKRWRRRVRRARYSKNKTRRVFHYREGVMRAVIWDRLGESEPIYIWPPSPPLNARTR